MVELRLRWDLITYCRIVENWENPNKQTLGCVKSSLHDHCMSWAHSSLIIITCRYFHMDFSQDFQEFLGFIQFQIIAYTNFD